MKKPLYTLILTFTVAALSAVNIPFVESYWESWDLQNYPQDYCSDLAKVPATPQGSKTGVNIVDLAFADYSGGIQGLAVTGAELLAGIQSVHQKGGLVKLSFGGANASMSTYIKTPEDADTFAQSVAEAVKDYDLDGIDFDMEDGQPGADLQLEVYKKCRQYLGDAKYMTFTIPALSELHEPWKTILEQGQQYFNWINVMAYDVYWTGYKFSDEVANLKQLGVPENKLVYGLMPGHHDAPDEYTSVADAENAAKYVKANGLAGVMTWDLNRDTDQRMNFPKGEDNLYQTGQPNGTFVDALSSTLSE